MSHAFRDDGEYSSDETAPTEAWLFARLIRGEPIAPIINPEMRARAKREELERLAQFSTRHAEQLSRIKIAEAEARRERESLQWAARISTRAEEQLRALQHREAEEREAWRRAEAFYQRYVANVTEWNPDQPRVPPGSPQGGQWSKGGGVGVSGGEPPSHLGPMTGRGQDSANHTSEPAAIVGTSSLVATSDQHPSKQDPKAAYLRDFDKGHDLNLPGALKDGRLSADDILRIKFTDDEIKQILDSARRTASGFNLDFYTGSNLPANLKATADREFPDLPPDERYALQAFISNQRRARVILMARNPAFQQYVRGLYEMFRAQSSAVRL